MSTVRVTLELDVEPRSGSYLIDHMGAVLSDLVLDATGEVTVFHVDPPGVEVPPKYEATAEVVGVRLVDWSAS